MQLLISDNLGGKHYLYEKVLGKPWKADDEFEERIC